MTSKLSSLLRLLLGLAFLGLVSALWALILILLLPSRVARIRACNYYGKLVGSNIFKIVGSRVTLRGAEHLDATRPAIYVSNHTSILDAFLGMWMSPVGTVGVAKREVVYYPFLGQMYLLSGHLRIDRGRSSRAIASMTALGEIVKRHRLSVFLWPEGTRSRDGRLLAFKKGFVHLAIQTGLPVVPLVVGGAHHCWEKGTLLMNPVPVEVTVLSALPTRHWTLENQEDAIQEVRAAFLKALPDEQQPLPQSEAA